MNNKHHIQVTEKTHTEKFQEKNIVDQKDTTKICLQPTATDYQTFILTTYKAMALTGKKPVRDKVRQSVKLILS